MARPTTLDDDAILTSARRVFLEKGIAATTADVAHGAGVSEGSLFKRWKTKDALFRAAMNHGTEDGRLADSLAARVGRSDIRTELEAFSLEAIEELRVVVPLVMMSWSNPSPGPCEVDAGLPKPMQVLKTLTGYFEAEMRLGRIRRTDAEIVARMFMGGLWHYVQLEIVYRQYDVLPLSAESYVRGFVDVALRGLEPTDPAPKTA